MAGDGKPVKLKEQLIEWGRSVVPAIAGAISFTGWVGVLGAAVVWMRFSTAGIPADQAVHDLPLGEWVATGAVALILYLVLGLAAAVLVYLLQEAVIASVLVNPEEGAAALRGELALVQGHAKQLREELAAMLPAGGGFPEPGTPAGNSYVAKKQEAADADERVAALAKQLREVEQQEARSAGQGNQWGMLVLVAAELVVIMLRTDLATELKVVFAVSAAAICFLAVARGALPKGDQKSLSGWLASGVLVFGVLLVSLRPWTFAAALATGLLALANLAAGRLRPQSFFWYGIAIFISVGLFGAVLTYSRDSNAPSAQPAAVLLKGGCAVRGLWIGESSDKVFLARLGKPEGKPEDNEPISTRPLGAGRIFWLKKDTVVTESVGKLQRVKYAVNKSGEMRAELLSLSKSAELTENRCEAANEAAAVHSSAEANMIEKEKNAREKEKVDLEKEKKEIEKIK